MSVSFVKTQHLCEKKGEKMPKIGSKDPIKNSHNASEIRSCVTLSAVFSSLWLLQEPQKGKHCWYLSVTRWREWSDLRGETAVSVSGVFALMSRVALNVIFSKLYCNIRNFHFSLLYFSSYYSFRGNFHFIG